MCFQTRRQSAFLNVYIHILNIYIFMCVCGYACVRACVHAFPLLVLYVLSCDVLPYRNSAFLLLSVYHQRQNWITNLKESYQTLIDSMKESLFQMSDKNNGADAGSGEHNSIFSFSASSFLMGYHSLCTNA